MWHPKRHLSHYTKCLPLIQDALNVCICWGELTVTCGSINPGYLSLRGLRTWVSLGSTVHTDLGPPFRFSWALRRQPHAWPLWCLSLSAQTLVLAPLLFAPSPKHSPSSVFQLGECTSLYLNMQAESRATLGRILTLSPHGQEQCCFQNLLLSHLGLPLCTPGS